MKTGQPRLPQQKGWQKKEIFQWGRQNGSWMPMPTSKNNGNGHPAGSTANTCVNRCSSMPLPLAGVNMTMLSTGAGELPLPKWDLGAEHTAMELVCPDSTQEDIEDLYWDVYQLQRLPGRGWCEKATEEHLHREILDSLKECTSGSSMAVHTARGGMEAVASWHPSAWPMYGVCHC